MVSSGIINGHEYVDLGLPSGTLWATCNVGANHPFEYGNYYAWGETSTKLDYSEWRYRYCRYDGYYYNLTKYCTDSHDGYKGFMDYLERVLPMDDAATVNWGSTWRMPTSAEIYELRYNCSSKWTTINGVNGRLFTAPNGNSLFLPAAGFRSGGLIGSGSSGYYWSSSLMSLDPVYASSIEFNLEKIKLVGYWERYHGFTIRAVSSSKLSVFKEDTGSSGNQHKPSYSSNTTNGCFIATAVYGSYNCPEVWTLRRFRDNTLDATWYGRAFIKTYYAISPTLVKWFGETDWFKKMWRTPLDRMVSSLQRKGFESTPYQDKY